MIRRAVPVTTACSLLLAALIGSGALGSPAPVAATAVSPPTPSAPRIVGSDYGQFTSVSCPTAQQCYAVGAKTVTPGGIGSITTHFAGVALSTANGGRSWTQLTLPGGTGALAAIACPSTTTCFAAGSNFTSAGTFSGFVILATTDGGATWTPQGQSVSGGYGGVLSLSCMSTTACVAVGADTSEYGPVVFTTVDGGTVWTSESLPRQVGPLSGVDCVSSSTCYAVGSDFTDGTLNSPTAMVLVSTDGGADWAVLPSPTGASQLGSISCTSVSDCSATGVNANVLVAPTGMVLTTTDGGATWTTEVLPATVGPLPAIACPTSLDCVVVGESFAGYPASTYGPPTGTPGVVLVTVDGGARWSSPGLPTPVGPLSGVDCPTVADCVAVGQNTNEPGTNGVIVATADGGSTWDLQVTPPQASEGALAAPVVGMAAMPDGQGYWLTNAEGAVSPHGNALDYGSPSGPLDAPITHIVATPDGKGYWMVAADGGVFAFGDAPFYGSMGDRRLNAPVVDIAPTPDGKGYWLVAADGGVFAFGDAAFRGSMGGRHLNRPVVGIEADRASGGYWLVASDGGIFAFGAPFYGSTGSLVLNEPVDGMAAATTGQGYRLVASDGGIFAFGGAPFYGSMGGIPLVAPVVGMATDGATGGYWMVAADGGVFAFSAPFFGAD